jgi:hypothetical protein
MAGKIIADTIEASGSQISLNVGNVTVLTASSTGLTLIPTTNVNVNLTNSIVTLTSGNVARPSLTFSGNTTTGIFMPAANTIAFGTAGTEDMRITSTGLVGIGTNSPTRLLTIQGSGAFSSATAPAIRLDNTVSGRPALIDFDDSQNLNIWSSTDSGTIRFLTATGAGTERMRIDSSGNIFTSGNYSVLYPGSGNATTGIFLESSGQLSCSRDNTVVARFNRNSTDGTLLSLSRQGTEIGTVSVSSGTVSYNAFAGSHWSQLSDGSKPVILRGTVLDSINELVQWPDEPTTERLCKVKVSNTVGSKKVYGVFMDWDNDWTATNDMYVTAVGAFICRVNASVTVQEGDLLESNGDGTARVQADDIIRSSTIGKVTCTEKTHQYDDGSYCVPTVLYCG